MIMNKMFILYLLPHNCNVKFTSGIGFDVFIAYSFKPVKILFIYSTNIHSTPEILLQVTQVL